jgi:hypothetical protein
MDLDEAILLIRSILASKPRSKPSTLNEIQSKIKILFIH